MTPPAVRTMRIRLVVAVAVLLISGALLLLPGGVPLPAQASAPAARTRTPKPPTFRVDPATTQLILGVAADWDAETVILHRFERRPVKAKKGARPKRGAQSGAQTRWVEIGAPWPARLGRGLAWGRGVNSREPPPRLAPVKREGDKRAPAGAFTVGPAFGYAADVDRQPTLPYVQVTPNDLFVADSRSPFYNQHLRLTHAPVTSWEKAQAMIRGDPAHRLKLFIGHNAPPEAKPGAGSAIFFHIWRRGGDGRSIGCTTMAEQHLRTLVRWVDPGQNPLYVLLPASEYLSQAESWDLPEVDLPAPPLLQLTRQTD